MPEVSVYSGPHCMVSIEHASANPLLVREGLNFVPVFAGGQVDVIHSLLLGKTRNEQSVLLLQQDSQGNAVHPDPA